uniref:hypothetical protein n=1 Tax=Flavobacterium sp. TaxID=239 RepID=UPI00404AFC98
MENKALKKRKLISDEISYIEKFIVYSEVKYYEIYYELLDHMIESVEEKLTETPEMDFAEAVKLARLDFQPLGFNGIMEERLKYLRKETDRDIWIRYKAYWTWPKAVGSLLVFLMFYGAFYILESKWIFFMIAIAILGTFIFNFSKTYKFRKKEGKRLLIIEQLNGYGNFLLMISYFFNIFFNPKFSFQEHPLIILFYSFLFTSILINIHIYLKIHEQLLPEIKRIYFA